MKKLLVGVYLLCAGFSVAGAEIPDWVMDPDYPGGIAAAECVTYSGSMSIDRAQAVASARVALAQRIEVRVKAVDKLYVERITAGKEPPQVKTVFESASQQLTDRVLANSRVVKAEIVRNSARSDQLCVMVALAPEGTKEYFKELVKVANAPLTPDLENELFESFRLKGAGTPKSGQSL